jgi:hypothetical protein
VAPKTAGILHACGVTRILGTRGLRRAIPGWSHESWTAPHSSLDRVTTETVDEVCLAYGGRPPKYVVYLPGVGRDASTVLSVKAPARRYRPSPPMSTVEPLGCETMGTARVPCYHGGGLLPGACDWWTLVLTPGLYAPKGQWALRSLTLEEVLIVKGLGVG